MRRMALALLFLLSPLAARAQEPVSAGAAQSAPLSRLLDWSQDLIDARAPAESALQTMRQVVGALQTATTPEDRGARLIAMGPQVSEALAQVRQAQANVETFPSLTTGDAEFDAMALSAHQAVRTDLSNLESALLALQQMHRAAVRRDVAEVRRVATSLLVFPPLWLRNSAASFRLMALQSHSDPSTHHFYQARAAFYEASAIAIDLSGPLDQTAFSARLDEAAASIAAGRAALAADGELAESPVLRPEQRALMAELLQIEERSFSVTQNALASLRESVSALGDAAQPEQRLGALRPAGQIERENSALAERASQLAAQLARSFER